MIHTVTTQAFIRQSMRVYFIKSLGAFGLLVCVMATGCSDSGQSSAVDEPLKKTDSSVIVTDVVNDIEPSATDINSTKTKEAQVSISTGLPVSYEVNNWKSADTKRFALDDLLSMQKIFGKVTVTDENSLDYASNNAIKYRFMEGDEPYLDIIDSQQYLEFGWYYANPNDSDNEKKLSVSHAKKVYAAAEGLMGEAGGSLVANMLKNQIIKNKEVGGQSIALAKCEFYSCMLIIKKP